MNVLHKSILNIKNRQKRKTIFSDMQVIYKFYEIFS